MLRCPASRSTASLTRVRRWRPAHAESEYGQGSSTKSMAARVLSAMLVRKSTAASGSSDSLKSSRHLTQGNSAIEVVIPHSRKVPSEIGGAAALFALVD